MFPTVLQWGILEDIYTIFKTYPLSFLLIIAIWIGLIVLFKYGIKIYVSPWIALMLLIVSAGATIGLLLYANQEGWISALVLFGFE
jgi:hypothetical protein